MAYSGLNTKNIKNLPIIDKKVMMENFDDFNTVGLKKEDCFKVAFKAEENRDFSPMINNTIIGLSSGTSGNRGLFIVSEKEKEMWAGGVLSKIIDNIFEKQKIAFFLRANSNLYESVGSKHIKFEFFDLLSPINEHILKLNTYKPTILIAPASMLVILAKEILKGNLIIEPKKIYSVAEILEEEDKIFLQKVFNQKILQVYQATEGFLGIACECGNIHLNEDILFIERDYIDEKRFYPIITDFTRTSQPIIRYKLNDILIEKEEHCKCGSIYTCLEKIEGRSDDIFYFKNNLGENVPIFPDYIRRSILRASDKIFNYQAIQKDFYNIEIYLEVSETLEKEKLKFIEKEIEKNIFNILKKFSINKVNIKYYGKILIKSGEKLRRIKRDFIV